MTMLKFRNETPVRNGHGFPAVNDFFNDLFDGMVTNDFKRWNTPAVNIIENDNQFKVQLAAPGLTKEDFKISVNDHVLTISAEKKAESYGSTERFTRREFSFSNFSRSFTLNEMVNVEGINASYENGIMTVTMPRLEAAKPKSKEIKIV